MPIHSHACACALALPLLNAVAADLPVSVEVAGKRYDQRREDTASTVVLGREELLRNGDRSLGDALRRAPGISVGDGGLRLRGMGHGYTRILIDGVAAPPGFNPEALAPELIERVEIAGSAAAELGTEAIAGTINIIMRKKQPRDTNSLRLGLDRADGRNSASLQGEAGMPFSLADSRQLERHIEQTGSRSTRQREDNHARVLTMAPRASWQLDNGDRLGAHGFVNHTRRSAGLAESDDQPGGQYPQRASAYQFEATWLRAGAQWSRKLADEAQLEFKFDANGSRRSVDFAFGPAYLPPVRHVLGTIRESGSQLRASYSRPLGQGHMLSAGWEIGSEKRSQTRVARENDAPGGPAFSDDRYTGTIERGAVYAKDEWKAGAAWALSAALRWETLRTSVQRLNQRSSIASPLLHVLYQATPERQLRLGLTRTYKAPTMLELIPRRYTADANNSAARPHTEGNPALRPEKAWGIDGGIDQRFGKDGLLAASFYARRIEDVTLTGLFMDGADWVSAPFNQGRALAHGFALEAKAPLGLLAVQGNLARNWSNVERIAGPGNRIADQVPLTAQLGLEYRAPLQLGLNYSYERASVSRLSAQWSSANNGKRDLQAYAVWGTGTPSRVRVAAANLLRFKRIETTQYGDVRTWRSGRPGAVLRLTWERELR